MSVDGDDGETTTLSPDDAFAVLGDETRMEILRTLGEADRVLDVMAEHGLALRSRDEGGDLGLMAVDAVVERLRSEGTVTSFDEAELRFYRTSP